MGRKTPPPKEHIAKLQSKAVRFGKGQPRRQDIKGAPIPWEIRKAYGTLCQEEIDLTSKNALNDVLAKINEREGRKLPTVAQSIAAAQVLKALKGDSTAAEIVTVNNEGKQPDTLNVNNTGSIVHKNTPLEGEKKQAAIEELARFASKFKNLIKE